MISNDRLISVDTCDELTITRYLELDRNGNWAVLEDVSDDYGERLQLNVIALNINKQDKDLYKWVRPAEIVQKEVAKAERVKTFENDLTSDQWRLHDYLNSIYPNGATKEHICNALPIIYPRHREDSTEHNSAAYNKLRADFQALKNSQVAQGVYGCLNSYYKRLTKKEFESYSSGEWELIVAKIKRINNQSKKYGEDKQARLVFGHEKGIVDTFMGG